MIDHGDFWEKCLIFETLQRYGEFFYGRNCAALHLQKESFDSVREMQAQM